MDAGRTDDFYSKNRTLLIINYVLYLLSWVVGITGLVAIIINYVKRREMSQDPVLQSHTSWQIRTFWWSLGIAILGMLLSLVGVGFIILIVGGIWVLYRLVKGLLRLNDNREIS